MQRIHVLLGLTGQNDHVEVDITVCPVDVFLLYDLGRVLSLA